MNSAPPFDQAPLAASVAMLRQPVTQLQILLVLALLLGGGGIVYGVRHFLLQGFALLLLGLNAGLVADFFRHGPRMLVALLVLTVAFPLLQLVPLPPAIWQALPGRELAIESLALAEYPADSWMPFSLDPARTALAFFATIVPATLIVIGHGLPFAEKVRLAWTAFIVAVLILLLGVVQLSSGNTTLMTQWITPDADVLYGTFSNRNTGGLAFLLAAILAISLPVRGGMITRISVGAGVALLVLGVVLTQSRTAMTLLLVFVGILGLRGIAMLRRKAGGAGRKQMLAAGLVAAAIVAALGISVLSGGRAADSIERFSTIQQDRLERWDDGSFTAGRYWPVGAGTGTFDDVFQIDESLEYLSLARAGRAHNDYLELAIETGIVGPLLLLLWLGWGSYASLRGGPAEERWLRLAASASLVCIALQSVLDYPLRNQAMLSLAALMIVLLAWRREDRA